MDAKKRYEDWLENPYFDENTKNELRRIADDEKEIEERFYKELEFGTEVCAESLVPAQTG